MNKFIFKTISTLLLFCNFSNLFGQTNLCVIKGTIINRGFNDIAYLVEGEAVFKNIYELQIVDSTKIKNGKFEFKLNLPYAKYYSVRLKSYLKGFTFIGTPNEKIFILSDTTNFKYPKISGSFENAIRRNYINEVDPLIFSMNDYVDSVSAYMDDTLNYNKYLKLFLIEQNKIRQLNFAFIRKNHKTLTALKMLNSYFKEFSEDSIKMILESLPKSLAENPMAKEIYYKKFVLPNELKKISGLYDLQFVDTLNNKYKFKNLEGKIALIEFWASWCKPCIENLPKVKSIYSRLDSSKFTILSISLDTDKDKWKKAIIKYELLWDNVIDEKAWEGIVLSYLEITGIPHYTLIGKNGEILENNINRDKLEETILKYLN